MDRRGFLKCLVVGIACPKWPDGKLGEGTSEVRPSLNMVDFHAISPDLKNLSLRIKSCMPVKVEIEFDETRYFTNPQKQEISDGQTFKPKGRYMRVMITSRYNSEDKVDIWVEGDWHCLILDEAA